ncbi:lytic murein transglycosylase [Ralstonia syzygii]|nr:lytic murein transglycosylase [Ralstonia syzygii]
MSKVPSIQSIAIFTALSLGTGHMLAHGQNLTQSASEPVASSTSATEAGLPGTDATFDAWLQGFRQKAVDAGISSSTFDSAFKQVTPDPEVVELDRRQPEFTTYIWDYLDKRITTERIQQGQSLLVSNYAMFQRLERDYGVDARVLAAIWAIESQYGTEIGKRYVIRSLATLANDGRRKTYAENQLLASLQILQKDQIPREQLVGSWAGAMGQTQFIPTTYLAYAVDGDGDQKRDVWNSSADALASAANYLKEAGWQRGGIWGREIKVPETFDYALADMSVKKSVAEWQWLGAVGASEPLPPQIASLQASILLPAGYRGPKFLVLDGYRAIRRYNPSTAYALAVALLADSYVGKGKLVQAWPTDDPALNNAADIKQLQQRLADKGYDPGTIDGLIGDRTQTAIRAYQKDQHLPQDGYASRSLLARLEK